MNTCSNCGIYGVSLTRKHGTKEWLCLDCDLKINGPGIDYGPENEREPEEFPGLEALVTIGPIDAETNLAMPAMDSKIL
jgi:hypothetical protein